MKGPLELHVLVAAACLGLSTGCATVQPKDYSAYRARIPRSILVLPAVNNTNDASASYSWLSTVSYPLGEAGYYVFPVAVVDQFLKENGLPTPGEMRTASLAKIGEVFGADAVLYVDVLDWGEKYVVLAANAVADIGVRLVDVPSGQELFAERFRVVLSSNSGGQQGLVGMLVAAVIDQIANNLTDRAHDAGRMANMRLAFDPNKGMLRGPRSPQYESDLRGR